MTSDHFFCPQNEKKNCLKQATVKFYPAEKWVTMYKKYMSLELYLLYCFVIQSLLNVYKNWILTFNIPLPNYCSG